MLKILEFIVTTLKNDTTLKGYVDGRIFPTGVDIIPEKTLFPLITFFTLSEVTRTVPKNVREGVYQIDVWSILSQLELENISERILTLLNYEQFRTGYGNKVLRWTREDASNDMYERHRRIWHKSLRFRTWVNNQAA